jgi:hypothetical protein
MGIFPQSRHHQRREEGGEEGREEGGESPWKSPEPPFAAGTGGPSRSRRAAALGSHAEPWTPSSARSWSCRGHGEDCRPGEPATPPLLHPLRCASTLRPGGARRPGTAVPRCTGGGGARRRHCVLALTTRSNDAAPKLLPGAPATLNRSSDRALRHCLAHDLLGVLPRR